MREKGGNVETGGLAPVSGYLPISYCALALIAENDPISGTWKMARKDAEE